MNPRTIYFLLVHLEDLIVLFISFNIYTCAELNNLNIYSQDAKTISLNFIQSYEGINKTNVEGQVYFEKPNLFKIITTNPSKTELIVNNQDVYRTDYDLNETIKYKLENIESQIPALLLLKSKKKVCSFLNNSQSSEFISDLNYDNNLDIFDLIELINVTIP